MNSHGKDFKGGRFHFKDGEPSTVVPIAGDVLIYTADDRNIHSVEEVLDGERLTLTLWFTRDSAHDEDTKLISLLSQMLSKHQEADNPNSYLPSPASDSMYWFSQDELGFDLRCARVHILGYSFYTTTDGNCNTPDLSDGSSGVLSQPLRLGRGDQIFEKDFINSLHALQVAQFYYWKSEELVTSRIEADNCTRLKDQLMLTNKSGLKLDLPCHHQLAKAVLGLTSEGDSNLSFDWNDFIQAVAKWEEYSYSLHKDLLNLIPFWLSHHAMFITVPAELQKCNKLNKPMQICEGD